MTPEMPPIRVWLLTLGVVTVLALLGQSLSFAQAVSEYQVKAAYLYNFAKFVEWPSRDFPSPSAPLRFCVLNDQAFESTLNQIVKGKVVGSHPASVVSVQNGEQSRSCHVLFINSSQARETQHILEVLRDTNVLTVGETKGFVEEGGMISFVLHDDSVQFQVNHKAAKQAGLGLSSRLLAVAKAVLE